jgi:hypothetical protein
MPKDIKALDSQTQELVEAVAAKIQPLPKNVVPSEMFMKQMRRRLLDLEPKASPRRAA